MTKMTTGLGATTVLLIADVEEWLDDNCDGAWEVHLADLETGGFGVKKRIEILFEKPADKEKFKALFRQFEKTRHRHHQDDADRQVAEKVRQATGGGGEGGRTRPAAVGMLRPDKSDLY